MRKQLTLLAFSIGYKNKSIPQLNVLNARRLNMRANLMARYLTIYGFWPMIIIVMIMFTLASIVAYLNPESGFYLMGILFWSTIFLALLIQLFAFLCLGIVAAILSTLYLKYRFQEINDKIELSLKLESVVLLLNAITEHNTTSKQTKDLNDFWV